MRNFQPIRFARLKEILNPFRVVLTGPKFSMLVEVLDAE